MDKATQASITNLANVYAQYFVQDFATNVMSHLSGSYPAQADMMEGFITDKINAVIGSTGMGIANNNDVSRFLYECASYVIERGVSDPEDRDVWNDVSALPSLRHDDIQALIYTAALLYQKTIDTTLLNVLARDAHTAAQTIIQNAHKRSAITETGGNLLLFNWGLLSDGMWTNGAMMRAQNLSGVFRSGSDVVSYYATVAFNAAHQLTAGMYMSADEQLAGTTDLDVIISHMDADTTASLSDLFAVIPQATLNSLLFVGGSLAQVITGVEDTMNMPRLMVDSVQYLSSLARLLTALQDAASGLSDDTLIGGSTVVRIGRAYDVVTLALVAFEALRETKYEKSLILAVVPDGLDPKVDVIVNQDLLNSYYAAGGEESDLIRFGLYLDPRKGMPESSNGWTLDYVISRRDDVVPQMIAANSERLEKLRNNDAAVIATEADRTIRGVVSSYLEAKGGQMGTESLSLRPDISQAISATSRAITAAGGVNLDEEILKILVAVMDDPFVSKMGEYLVNHAQDHGGDYAHSAVMAKTIAEAAINDAISYVTRVDEPVVQEA